MESIDVSIILINYKNAKLTSDAVDSVIEKSRGFSYEIIVVDNSNDSAEFAALSKLLEGKAICVDAKANLGFGKGNNLGVVQSKGKYVHFLNNDTLLMNNAICELFRFLEEHHAAGIAGSNLYSLDGKPNHSFTPYVSTAKDPLKSSSILAIIRRHLLRRPDFNYGCKPLKIGGHVVGASLMISRADFDRLGGFDKDIFMYAEEALLCYRLINELGLEIYNVPSSKIIHFEGRSFGETPKAMTPWRAKECANGMAIYLKRAFGEEEAIAFFRNTIKAENKILRLAKLTRKGDAESHINRIRAAEDKLKELENA